MLQKGGRLLQAPVFTDAMYVIPVIYVPLLMITHIVWLYWLARPQRITRSLSVVKPEMRTPRCLTGEQAGNSLAMEILLWIVFGLIAGAIAKYVVGGGPGGILGDIVVGILGAIIGGFIYGLLGHPGITGFDFWSLICAIIGAIVLLIVLRALRRPVY